MQNRKQPLNISYLDNRLQRIAGLLPVKVLDMYGADREYHPQGLYSNEIFGTVGTEERSKRHGYINTRTQLLHPKTFEEMTRLKGLYKEIMQGKTYARWDAELKDFVKADILDGQTGYSFFMSHFKELDFPRTKSYRRDLVIDLINRFREQSVLNFLIVMPAGLRDVEIDEQGRPVEPEVNKLYRKILAAANSISDALVFKNDPILDRTRWSMQVAIQELWQFIMGMLGGKGGFLQSKWGSRRVVYATRNVISAMDPAPEDLNSPRTFDLTTTQVGIFQFIKGTEPVMVLSTMPQGIAQPLCQNPDGEQYLIDPKTLESVPHQLSETERVNWGSEKGRLDLLNMFGEKHRPFESITVDGLYLKLVYRDRQGYRLLDDIRDLPTGFEPKNVYPLTWGEYFYMEAETYIARVRCLVTRYPVTGTESIYPSVPYLKSTVDAKLLYPYNEQWVLDKQGKALTEYPVLDTNSKTAFVDTCIVSPFYIAGLGADYDGDKVQTPFVFSDEGVAEIDRKLDSIENYVNAAGEMEHSASVETIERVLRSFTGFK